VTVLFKNKQALYFFKNKQIFEGITTALLLRTTARRPIRNSSSTVNWNKRVAFFADMSEFAVPE